MSAESGHESEQEAINQRQAFMFDRIAAILRRCDLAPSQWVAHYADCSPRHASRLISGTQPLKESHFRGLLKAGFDEIKYIVADYLLEGAGLVVIVPEDGPGDVDAGTVAALREVADIVDQRLRARADGRITAEEKAELVAAVDKSIRTLFQMRHDAQSESVVKRCGE